MATAYRQARSVEELTEQNVQAMQRLESETKTGARHGALDRLADRVSEFCGSTLFLWVHVLWFTAWIGCNGVPAA